MAPSSGNDFRLVKDILFTVPVSAEEDAATIITSLAAFPLAVKTVNWFVPFSTNPILPLTAVPPPRRATSGVPLAQLMVAKLSQLSANADPAKAHMIVSRRRTRLSRVPNGGEGIVDFSSCSNYAFCRPNKAVESAAIRSLTTRSQHGI